MMSDAKAMTTKSSTNVVEAENLPASNIIDAIEQLKHAVGDLALFDDISIEADVDAVGPRAKTHFRFRCYRRAGG